MDTQYRIELELGLMTLYFDGEHWTYDPLRAVKYDKSDVADLVQELREKHPQKTIRTRAL